MIKYSGVDRLLGLQEYLGSFIMDQVVNLNRDIAVCNEGPKVLHLVMPVSLFVFVTPGFKDKTR
jgi:hypothetical protein